MPKTTIPSPLKPKRTFVIYLLRGENTDDHDTGSWFVRAYQDDDAAKVAMKAARQQLKAFQKACSEEPGDDTVREDRRIYRKFRHLCAVDTVADTVLIKGSIRYSLMRLDLW